ncbi:microcin-processing peptidase 2. Unknown type peptidase. MEROPS family U62 [Candidatus Kryptonium thompsonii]|uniref:TldD protein n=2 Tax=Candidatus Kryptonium thompsonii TaxID=1633631 RepID=A0A0P1MDE2_9BACT|nr:metallopeptidase TldD-related protein [Candidatus Kryptonium thompsoni]CUS84290.1 microcin-processing peptidase 2. Unknown type peptidase. MEROPS family U62 [Candidatus Kryptonium thompsoni]CUS85832.1 microcin-processing peptidase 2. Unknown type peptidase. MEROPS family U62 [Candidatus Kryptonium thompsoni]CUS87791.1 microcin-processing peptidase 2. Unknown type peptidase. MEROPS family U62 [Candidatus Kryptonium thompsoni]CUS93584.1 microcin-processing peptidase 2. Unknown type peptidase. 
MYPEILEHWQIKKVLEKALARGGEFSEIYFEYKTEMTINLSENKIKNLSYGISSGLGVRVISGAKTGYAYTDDFSFEKILNVAEVASYVVDNSSRPTSVNLEEKRKAKQNFSIEKPIYLLEVDKKIEWIKRANDSARSYDGRIKQVDINYYESTRYFWIANSEGIFVESDDSLFRIFITSVAIDDGLREMGISYLGGRFGYDYLVEHSPEKMGMESAMQAVSKLKAKPAPAGNFPVVIKSGWGGVLVHEAVGHGLEGDFNRKGISVYSGKIGQKVCSELVTIIDDGTIPNSRGSLAIDDEGTPMMKTVLIENGMLRGYMLDKLNAKLMGLESTGNGRRESYKYYPLPRMRNTYIEAGKDDPNDLIKSVKYGIYAKSLGGGQVDIVSGNFVFEINEGYLIENGEITYQIRGANLIGNGPEIMKRVIGVGNDLEIEKRTGSCGKDGQYVPVGVGQPTILVSEITVGGTQV